VKANVWLKLHSVNGDVVPCRQYTTYFIEKPSKFCDCGRMTVVVEYQPVPPKRAADRQEAA